MPSNTERPWVRRVVPSALRQRVAARASLLWLITTAAFFAVCLTSFLVWAADDGAVTVTPNRGGGAHQSAPPDDAVDEAPAEEEPVEEAPAEEAPAEEEPAEEVPAEGEGELDTEASAEESAPAEPSVLPIVISGASGFGGLLSGVAAMITVRQASDKGRRQSAPDQRRPLTADDDCDGAAAAEPARRVCPATPTHRATSATASRRPGSPCPCGSARSR